MAKVQARGRKQKGGNHTFAQIPTSRLPRSRFDRSNGLITAFDSGFLVPVFCDEVLPGDTCDLKVSTFARMSTPIHPVMDNMHLDMFFFFVPDRLLWDNFEKFMGAQDDPGDPVDFVIPEIVEAVGVAENSISDYIGIPPGVPVTFNAKWHRAYNLIFKDWFRSEDLQDSPVINLGDGPDDIADYALLRRGKRHDYFTSALPFPQKGEAVELSIGGTAVVTGITGDIDPNSDDIPIFIGVDGGSAAALFAVDDSVGGVNTVLLGSSTTNRHGNVKWDDPKLGWTQTGTGSADLSTATGATINAIRQSVALQQLYEKDARGGTRYTEIVKAHFGVTSPDARLQRPEFLGGGHTSIEVNPVPQTSETDGSAQGTLAAFVTSSGQTRGFMKSFTEHGVIIGLACVRADLTYQQGLHRMFTRRTKHDLYWSDFAHLGEQNVLSGEIFHDGTSGDDDVFGYQERFAEYRFKPSQVTSVMRSSHSVSLDTWHLAQDFATRPTLNAAFIEENPPINRVVAVDTEPQFIFNMWCEYYCTRIMPTYSVPGLERF